MKTRATATILSILLIASLLGLITNFKPASATPTTIQVSPGSSIQAAINSASPGDTILVAAGTYTENVTIDKAIALNGSGRDVTIIKAMVNWKPVIDIQSNNVNVSGFTIKNGSSGINVSGYNASRISDNKIVSNDDGILLLSSCSNIVFSNIISINTFDGVFLDVSSNNLVYDNVVTHNGFEGIGLVEANNNIIRNNTLALHNWGIWLDSSNNSTFLENTIANNNHSSVNIHDCYNNTFYRNNFFNKTQQIDTSDAVNSWNMTTEGTAEGNYWSDYTKKYPSASEVDNSGIWDTPYVIDEKNKDNFPLVSPWYLPKDVTPPFTRDNYDGSWHTENFTVDLTADDDLSDVKETYYKINDASQTSNVTANGQPYITTEGSNNTLEYWSVDKVGNNENHHFLTNIKLDKTPPTGSIQINNSSAYTISLSVTLNLSATDLISGVSQMRFSNDNTTWTPWELYSTSKAWDLATGDDGTRTVYVIFVDNADLSSQVYYNTIVLDMTSPTISIFHPKMSAEIKSQSVTINWDGADTGSGIDHYELTLDAGSPINVGTEQAYPISGLSDGSHTVVVEAFDKSGQSNEAAVTFVINTSPLGGPGYIEEAMLIVTVAAAIAITAYILRMRKRHRLEPKTKLPVKT